MIVVSIIFSLGSYIASQLTKLMIKHMSHIAVLGIAEGWIIKEKNSLFPGFYAFAIVLGFFMLTTKKPKTNRLIVEDQPEDVYGYACYLQGYGFIAGKVFGLWSSFPSIPCTIPLKSSLWEEKATADCFCICASWLTS